MAIYGVSAANANTGERYRLSDKREAAQDTLQNVFTAVLKQVGRQGYASADQLASEADLPEQIGSSWHQWFDSFSSSRYTFHAGAGNPSVQAGKSADDVRNDYQVILLEAYHAGGYAHPEQYVRSLSDDQLRTIQQVHHLAEPIRTDNLSTEASLNLLLPPGSQVDEDHDGLTTVGAARLIGFPNSDTPKNVRAAWDAAIEKVPEQERMIYQLQMMMPLLTANLKVDENGQFLRRVEPGDSDWHNPMGSPDYSYTSAANQWLEYLDRFRNQMPFDQYQRDTSFWTTFRDQLSESSSA